MTLLYFLFALWIVFILWDFKKAVLCYAPFKILFYYDVRLTAALPFDMAIMLVIAVLFFVKGRKYRTLPFPFKKGYLVYAGVFAFGCIVPVWAIGKIPACLVSILLYSYIYYQSLRSMKDVKLAMLSYLFFSIFLIGNGIYEFVFHSCPVDDWIKAMPYIDKEHAWETNFDLLRMGMPRIRSFIPFSITYGVVSVIIFAIPFYLYFDKQCRCYLSISKLLICISGVLLIIGVITSSSRSPILGILVLFSFLLMDKKFIQRNFKKILMIAIILLITVWPVIYQNILSIVYPTSSVSEDFGGSTLEMRGVQYAIAFDYMMKNPLIGLGKGIQITDSLFYGGESIWLPIMISNGIIGIFGYVYLYLNIVKNTKIFDRKYLNLVTLSWLIMNTATSLMGVGDATYLTIFLLLYRYSYMKQSFKSKL